MPRRQQLAWLSHPQWRREPVAWPQSAPALDAGTSGYWACAACVDTSGRVKGREVTRVEGVTRRWRLPQGFKREAVSASLAAAELGLPDRLVSSWLRWVAGQARAARGMGLAAKARAVFGINPHHLVPGPNT